MAVHRTAIIDPGAELGADVEVGPFAVIEKGVVVGDRCRIGPHACLKGPLVLGEDNEIGFAAAVGHDPQVKGKRGPFGATRIGHRNVIREYTTVNRSMAPDGETILGDDNYLMAVSHVAHDCVIGNHVVIANGCLPAGHVTVQDRVFLSGNVVIHQFCRIGELAMVGGSAVVNRDVPPYVIAIGGRPCVLKGLNVIGLRRAGFSKEARAALQVAYRTFVRSRLPIAERLADIAVDTPEVRKLVEFLQTSERGITGSDE